MLTRCVQKGGLLGQFHVASVLVVVVKGVIGVFVVHLSMCLMSGLGVGGSL